MKEKSVILKSQNGLHARPASDLVKLANDFQAEISIEFNQNKVNAKSILGLLTLAATYGSELIIVCDGHDEEAALDSIVNFFSDLKV